jgi:hypothetical protein
METGFPKKIMLNQRVEIVPGIFIGRFFGTLRAAGLAKNGID